MHLKTLEHQILIDRLSNSHQVNIGLVETTKKMEVNQSRVTKLETLQTDLLKGISDRDLNIEYLDKTVNELK